jgi:hypothetical protein
MSVFTWHLSCFLGQENCKVRGLVHFSASKTLPLAKSVGRKHGPDPFLATLPFSCLFGGAF